MTRIIAGSARGRRLRTPPGDTTRPTADRVREALFSSLEAELGGWDGIRFLDLYAGSGAVGLEALSRGAAAATLVEQDRRALGVLRANVATLGLPGAQVLAGPVERVVAHPPAPGAGGSGAPGGFDVVFADPPYPLASGEVDAVVAALVAHGWLATEALVVVERGRRGEELRFAPPVVVERTRSYGEATLWYGRADA